MVEVSVKMECLFLGNYYSLRSQHEKAVLYFQRALKISPAYLCAWTLMGHEYMELKNTSAAIQAYRQAVGKEPYACCRLVLIAGDIHLNTDLCKVVSGL